MAVRAENTRAVAIIEQDKFANYFVLIGRKAFAENAKRRIAVALSDIAEYLIVSPIFLNNVNNMFEHTWLADAFRHRARRSIRTRRQCRFLEERITHVGQSGPCERGQL